MGAQTTLSRHRQVRFSQIIKDKMNTLQMSEQNPSLSDPYFLLGICTFLVFDIIGCYTFQHTMHYCTQNIYCAYIDINTNILIGKTQLMHNTHKCFCNFTQKLSWKSCYVCSISVRDESKKVLPKHRLLFSSVKRKPSSKTENKF